MTTRRTSAEATAPEVAAVRSGVAVRSYVVSPVVPEPHWQTGL